MGPRPVLPLAIVAGMLLAVPATDVRADPLFDSRDFLHVTLTGPLTSLARDRDADPEYRPGTLAYTDADGHDVALDLQLRPRGNSRRDHHVCSFPPLRLNFAKKQVRHTLFDGQDKLKLVTYCRRSSPYAAYVYKEYLAYRILNQVTDASFQVRGVIVDYVDQDKNGRAESHFGFFIEDKRRLAKRLHLKAVEPNRIDPADLEPEHTGLMELFEFMIGNTDFSFIAPAQGDTCCHNAVLLKNESGRYLPIPYDFDISGLVDPPYAIVDGRLPIRSVRDRLFRGFCRPRDVQLQAVARYRSAQPSIVEVMRGETPLSGRARSTAQRYIDDFFDVLDDPARLERQILGACRGGVVSPGQD